MNQSRPKFNVIDALVILAVIAIIAAAVWFLSSATAGNEKYVFFTVEFAGQMPDAEQRIRATSGSASPEAEVRDSIRLYLLGHAWDVWSRPAQLITFDNNANEFVLETIPDRYDVFLTIRGIGTEDDRAIMTNGQIVRVGQEMFIRGRGYAGIGFITEIWTEDR